MLRGERGPDGEARPDLRFARLLAVWAPLAVTFLLVTGGTPVINASVNRLPGRDHAADLAAFALFLQVSIVLHSPLFVIREIAIKLAVDRAGARRALGFGLSCAGVVAAAELLFGLTPVGRIVLEAFADDPALVARAHPAFLIVWPAPFFIAIRGTYQAHQIRADDTLFVAAGTFVRLAFTAVLGLLVAPHLGVSGPILGALCVIAGIAVEAFFAVVRARRRTPPPERSDTEALSPLRFGLPLMLANSLGVAASLFFLRIASEVPAAAQAASLAGFQEVKSLHWMLASGAFALQSLTTAKVRRAADTLPMLRFGLVVGGGLTFVLAAIAYTPLRRVVLVDLLAERPDGDVLRFAVPTLMVAAWMPLLNGVRFSLRGALIARGRTRAITASTVTTLVLLGTALSFGLLPFPENGALNAYTLWTATLLAEIAILARMTFRAPRELPPPVRTGEGAAA